MAWRTLLGKWPAGTPGSGYGLRISYPGANAHQVGDASLMFSSDWTETLSIRQTGVMNLNTGGGAGPISGSVSFPSIGVTPHMCFAVDPLAGGTQITDFSPIAFLTAFSNRTNRAYLDIEMFADHFDATLYYGGTLWPTNMNLYYCIFSLPAQ